jgi:hypothetical protein
LRLEVHVNLDAIERGGMVPAMKWKPVCRLFISSAILPRAGETAGRLVPCWPICSTKHWSYSRAKDRAVHGHIVFDENGSLDDEVKPVPRRNALDITGNEP